MRTWLLAAALLVLALVAGADALRSGFGEAEGPTAPAPTATQRAARIEPVAAEMRGVLLYADESCELRGLSLPARAPAGAPQWSGCDFALSPRGDQAVSPITNWAPDETTFASESEGSILVSSTPASGSGYSLVGSAPAFRPDGLLSFFRDGEVSALDVDCARAHGPHVHMRWIERCSEVVLPKERLRRAARPETPELVDLGSVTVKELAWLDSTRPVAILELRGRFHGRYQVVVVFSGRGFVRATAGFDETFSDLQVSPFRRYFGLRSEQSESVRLFDRGGNRIPIPPLREARAFAFSPDERWLAVATRSDVFVFRTGSANARVFELGLTANDLAWRPG
jgi:hypothetical protein